MEWDKNYKELASISTKCLFSKFQFNQLFIERNGSFAFFARQTAQKTNGQRSDSSNEHFNTPLWSTLNFINFQQVFFDREKTKLLEPWSIFREAWCQTGGQFDADWLANTPDPINPLAQFINKQWLQADKCFASGRLVWGGVPNWLHWLWWFFEMPALLNESAMRTL